MEVYRIKFRIDYQTTNKRVSISLTQQDRREQHLLLLSILFFHLLSAKQ